MDQQVLLWVLGTAVSLLVIAIGGIIRLMVAHGRDCTSQRIADAVHRGSVDAKLERILTDIGDHRSGLRGTVHDLREFVSPFVIRAQLEEERRERK